MEFSLLCLPASSPVTLIPPFSRDQSPLFPCGLMPFHELQLVRPSAETLDCVCCPCGQVELRVRGCLFLPHFFSLGGRPSRLQFWQLCYKHPSDSFWSLAPLNQFETANLGWSGDGSDEKRGQSCAVWSLPPKALRTLLSRTREMVTTKRLVEEWALPSGADLVSCVSCVCFRKSPEYETLVRMTPFWRPFHDQVPL